MLEGLRAAQNNWIGKIIIGILMSFIVFSFAIWGIGDIFRNYGVGKVARVGTTDISAEAFRQAYQAELANIQRRNRGVAITNDQARAAGIPTAVMSRLVSDAALDEEARKMGLAISDDEMAKAIRNDPAFKNAAGAFDRDRFNEVLREAGYSEAGFVREQRRVYLRQEIAEAVGGAITAPKAVLDGLYRYSAETRSIDYIVLPVSAAGEIAPPTPEALQKYFDDRKSGFRAPEYRKLVTLAVTPATLAKPEAVSDEDAVKRYESVRAARYGTPEKRTLQQIVFAKTEEANEASAKIKSGARFEAIAEERKIAPADLDIGTRSRAEMFDQKTSEAAFALAEGAVSGPIVGAFGTALVRVTKIVPESFKPFADVAADLKRELAAERARAEVQAVYTKIEESRTAGKPLTEAARGAGLDVRVIDAIDQSGRDKAGAEVTGLTDGAALLRAAFASDIGVDNDTVQTRDRGYVWFEVTGIEPPRDRTLDEMRDEVRKNWLSDETSKRLVALSGELVRKIDTGVPITEIAAAQKAELRTMAEVKRSGTADLPGNVATQVFNSGDGKAGSAVGEGDTRVVYRVTGTKTPPLDLAGETAKKMQTVLSQALTQDMLTEFAARLQSDAGVAVNEQIVRQATGGGEVN